jgi:hypothetical protein
MLKYSHTVHSRDHITHSRMLPHTWFRIVHWYARGFISPVHHHSNWYLDTHTRRQFGDRMRGLDGGSGTIIVINSNSHVDNFWLNGG